MVDHPMFKLHAATYIHTLFNMSLVDHDMLPPQSLVYSTLIQINQSHAVYVWHKGTVIGMATV